MQSFVTGTATIFYISGRCHSCVIQFTPFLYWLVYEAGKGTHAHEITTTHNLKQFLKSDQPCIHKRSGHLLSCTHCLFDMITISFFALYCFVFFVFLQVYCQLCQADLWHSGALSKMPISAYQHAFNDDVYMLMLSRYDVYHVFTNNQKVVEVFRSEKGGEPTDQHCHTLSHNSSVDKQSTYDDYKLTMNAQVCVELSVHIMFLCICHYENEIFFFSHLVYPVTFKPKPNTLTDS